MDKQTNTTALRWVIGFGVAAFLVVLALDLYPGLRGGAGWHWPYAAPEAWEPVLILLLSTAAYVGGALLLRRSLRVWPLLTWAVIGGTVLAYAVVNVSAQGDATFHLFTRTVSPVQTGASAIAVRVMQPLGIAESLQQWPQIMQDARAQNLIHFTTSPPGQPLLHDALADWLQPIDALHPLSRQWRAFQCSEAPVMAYTRGEILSAGLVALLMPFFAALTALPLFESLRLLTDDRRLARDLAGWWPLVPAALLFAPTWNTLYPLLLTGSLALLLRALLRDRLAWLMPAGLLTGLATTLNFSVLPVLLLFGLLTLGFWWTGTPRRSFAWALRAGLWFGLGLMLPWLPLSVVGGWTPLDLWAVTSAQHSDLVQRDYLPWLILHPYDVLTFTGWAAAALALWGMVGALRGPRSTPLAVFTLALLLTLTALNLSGMVQGENARILIYVMPLLLIAAALPVHGRPAGWDVPLFVVQGVTVVVMGAVLAVVPLDLNPQPDGPRRDIGGLGDGLAWITADVRLESAAYEGAIHLDSYRYVADPSAQAITYELQWRGEQPTERPYVFSLHATAQNPTDGQIIADPFTWQAQGGRYLTTCWQAGDSVRDVVVLPLPVISEPVVWDVTLHAVDPRTGDSLPPLTLEPVRYP